MCTVLRQVAVIAATLPLFRVSVLALNSKPVFEMATNFQKLGVVLDLFSKRIPWKVWNLATANQTSDGSALKVDSNCYCLIHRWIVDQGPWILEGESIDRPELCFTIHVSGTPDYIRCSVMLSVTGAWPQRRPERNGAGWSVVFANRPADGSRESDSVEDDSLGRLYSSTVAQTLHQIAAH